MNSGVDELEKLMLNTCHLCMNQGFGSRTEKNPEGLRILSYRGNREIPDG